MTDLFTDLIQTLVAVQPLEADQFAKVLAATPKLTDETPYTRFYECNEFKLAGPLALADLRLGKQTPDAWLILYPQESLDLKESDLDLNQWGPLKALDLNPRIPPEGADAQIYAVNGVEVSFQFTHTSHQLRLVALRWKGSE